MNLKASLSRQNDESAKRDDQQKFEIIVAKLYLRVFPKSRFRIYSMLGRLLEADIDARSALEFIYDVLSKGGRNKGDFEAVAVAQWIAAFREHGRIADALTGWVPQTEVLLLEAGERSGRFQHALKVMLRLNEKMSSIRGIIFGKLAYPVATSMMLCGVLYFMATGLIPQLVMMKGGPGLFTGSAGTVVALMEAIRVGLIPFAIVLLIAVIAIFATMPFFRGPVRVYFDRLPPWATHRFISGTSFLSALLVLTESGRNLVDALTLVQPNASPYLAEKIGRVHRAMLEGAEFGEALAASGEEFPDNELIKEIQIYGRIGRLDEGLLNVVEQWMETATDKTRAQIAFLGLIIMGISFAVIALVFSGIYDIVSQIKQG